MVQLLLPMMAPEGRIVVVSSGTHDPAVKAPMPEPKYNNPAEIAMLRRASMPPTPFAGLLG